MVCCCVPFCKSKQGKVPGVSFHEFPVDNVLRERWLKIISRKNFTINDKSPSSVVCSKHFRQEDFVPNIKSKRLLPGTTPSVFEGYPAYKIPKKETPRRKINRVFEPQVKRRKVSENPKYTTPSENFVAGLVDTEQQSYCKTSTEQQSNCKTSTEQQSYCKTSTEQQSNCKTSPEQQSYCKTSPEQQSYCKTSVSVQTSDNLIEELSKTKRERDLTKRKVSRLNNKIAKLQGDLEKLKTNLNKYEKSQYHKALEDILEDGKDHTNMIILEHLFNHKKKNPRWSPDTLKMYNALQAASPEGYRFARKNGILRLPSKTTLKRFLDEVSKETEITEAIKQRLGLEASQFSHSEIHISLISDEMAVQAKLQYDKKLDCYFGEMDTTSVTASQKEQPSSNDAD